MDLYIEVERERGDSPGDPTPTAALSATTTVKAPKSGATAIVATPSSHPRTKSRPGQHPNPTFQTQTPKIPIGPDSSQNHRLIVRETIIRFAGLCEKTAVSRATTAAFFTRHIHPINIMYIQRPRFCRPFAPFRNLTAPPHHDILALHNERDITECTMPEPAGPPSITTRQAGHRLGVSPATVNRLIHAGELKAIKKTTLSGRPQRNSPYLVDLASVIEYEARRRSAP